MSNTKKALADNLAGYFGQAGIQKGADFYTELQKPLLKGAQIGISMRVLHYWKQHINMNVEVGAKKRYSFYEIVWLRMVQRLCAANMSMATLNIVYSHLTKPLSLKGVLSKQDKIDRLLNESKLDKQQREQLLRLLNVNSNETPAPSQITLLHILIMEAVLKKLPLSVAVFLDGSIQVIDNSKGFLYSEAEKNRLLFETYTVVSVTGIIRDFLTSDLAPLVLPHITILPPVENKLFEFINSGNYETITIHFKDRKIKDLELKKSVDTKSRIVDLLNTNEFGQIIIKKHKGEIVKIENTTKVTL